MVGHDDIGPNAETMFGASALKVGAKTFGEGRNLKQVFPVIATEGEVMGLSFSIIVRRHDLRPSRSDCDS